MLPFKTRVIRMAKMRASDTPKLKQMLHDEIAKLLIARKEAKRLLNRELAEKRNAKKQGAKPKREMPRTVYNLIRFVDPEKGYSDNEFAELIAMCEKHEYVLGVSTVCDLAAIPDRRRRMKLQRDAITGKWTARQVTREIKSRGLRKHRRATRAPRFHDDRELLEKCRNELDTLARFMAQAQGYLANCDGNNGKEWTAFEEDVGTMLDSARRLLRRVDELVDQLASNEQCRKKTASRRRTAGAGRID